MQTVDVSTNNTIVLGRANESGDHDTVVFDISSIRSEHGDGLVSLRYRRSADEPVYIPSGVTVNDDTVTWVPSKIDLGIKSNSGECEIRFEYDNGVYISRTFPVVVLRSVVHEPQDLYDGWLNELQEYVTTITEADAIDYVEMDEDHRLIVHFVDGTSYTSPSLLGPKGEKGDKGDTGEKGDKGDTGEKGDKGDKGDTGEKGDKGDKGDTGEKGDKGDRGAKGNKGDMGDRGPQGVKGDKGDKGDKGNKGDTGATGPAGATGAAGPQGPQGEKGDTGEDGASAYEQAVDGGFSGTEEEFIDILGSIGEKKPVASLIYNTVSGSIATFTDGADDLSLKSAVVSIEPIQEGSGDPSPENIRAISGRTGCYISKSSQTYPLVQGSIGDNDGREGTAATRIRTDYIPYSNESSLTFYCKNSKSTDRIRRIYWFNSLKEFISSNPVASPVPSLPTVYSDFTPPENAAYYRIVIQNSPSTDNISPDGRVLVVNPIITSVNWETEAGTVYGGSLDPVRGKLTVNKAYIASYNGETLPSTWISDRDVYAAGITPATGAQVVYKLAEPVEYQLSPNEIRTLLGENNIFSDGGDMTVEYPADTKTYIDAFSIKTVEVSGQTPIITAEENTRYICGEVTSLDFTPCETGICDIRFTAASISTVLTLPQTLKLPDWFDPTSLEANVTYEINIMDGVYGAVMSWA